MIAGFAIYSLGSRGFGEFRKRTQSPKACLEAVQVIEIGVAFAKGLNLRFKGVACGRRCNARRLSRCVKETAFGRCLFRPHAQAQLQRRFCRCHEGNLSPQAARMFNTSSIFNTYRCRRGRAGRTALDQHQRARRRSVVDDVWRAAFSSDDKRRIVTASADKMGCRKFLPTLRASLCWALDLSLHAARAWATR
jgi:hypothetical protein